MLSRFRGFTRGDGTCWHVFLWEKNGGYFHKKAWGLVTQTVENKDFATIYGYWRGWAFFPVSLYYRQGGYAPKSVGKTSRIPFNVSGFRCQAFRPCQKDGTSASITPQTTSVAYLGSSRFSAFALTWPPSLAEQQRIADCLTRLEAQIAAQSQKLAALKTHKKALM